MHKAHIVELAWESWDRAADLPPQMPDSGEPEDFVLEGQHSPSVAARVGELWEVVLPVVGSIERVKTGARSEQIVLVLDEWNGEELFRAQGVLYNYASERAEEWLRQTVPEHVDFKACESKTVRSGM